MTDLLPPGPLLLAFLGASLVLALTPGPAVVYIVARTLAQGRVSGLASVAGVALGNFGNAVGAAVGLAALLAVSASLFTVVKLAGAAYLLWLGMKLWREAEISELATTEVPPPASPTRIFRDGFVVALLNPKTALFFAAFLPQFLSRPEQAMAQSIALGGVFAALAAGTDTAYVLLAGVVATRLQRAAPARKLGQRLAGSAFIGLGVLTALTRRPA